MIHFAVFGYLFVVLVGMVCLAIALFLYFKNKSRFFLQFINYFSAFTLFIFSYLFIQTYIFANVQQITITAWLTQIGIVFVSFAFFIFSILHFSHFLVYNRSSFKKTVWEVLISLTAMIGMILSIKVNWSDQQVYQEKSIALFFSIALIFCVIIYSLILKLVHFKNISEERKNLVRQTLVINTIFIPGFALDFYLIQKLNFTLFIPIFYLCSSLVFLRYFIKNQYNVMIGSDSDFPHQLDNADLDQAGISTREKEIIELILKGYSNKKIADQLFISISTVKTHIRNIFQKLNVKSRFEIITKLKG